jgi:hypothetical protein
MIDRESLRAHLVEHRIAGDVATPRQSNLAALQRLAAGDERTWFGLPPRRAPYDDLLAVMVERVGIDADPAHTYGLDRIDPDRTVARLDAMREALTAAAGQQPRVFLASGHPAGVLAIHVEIAAVLRAHGCEVLTPDPGLEVAYADRRRQLRYVAGVGVLSNKGDLNHTHSAEPMRALLDRGMAPDLVIADHGWAGAAAAAGIRTLCFADCNDPALVIGEADGVIEVCVPLDDNVLPHLYEPLSDYLLAGLR